MIFGGIVLLVAAVGVAVKDTWDNKDELSNDISTVKRLKEYDPAKEHAENPDNQIMTIEDAKKQLSRANKKLIADMMKTYWKTTALTGGSVVLILSGRRLMRKQIAELAAMYASLLESYRRYRQNVISDLGAEKDQEYAYGVKTIDTIDSETGEVVKKVVVDGTRIASRYARWMNEGDWDKANQRFMWENRIYTPNKLELEARLHSIQSSCNDILRMRGWMTLNEVYYKLGFPPTEEGQHVGWVRGGFTDGTAGDDFIDFGVFPDYCHGKYQLPVNRLFLDHKSNQRCPLLDFNVICLDKIWNNIYEYDNRSSLAYEQRRTNDYEGSKESLDRWFSHSEYYDN